MVRKELLVLISCLVKEWRGYFVVCAWLYWEEDRKRRSGAQLHEEEATVQAVSEWLDGFGDDDIRDENRVLLSSCFTIFTVLLELSVDPYQEVATNAQTVLDYIMALLLESPFKRLDSATLDFPPDQPQAHTNLARSRVPSLQSSPSHAHQIPSPSVLRPSLSRTDTMSNTISTGVSNTLRRTSSFANALKNLAGTIAFPSSEDGRASPAPGSIHNQRVEIIDLSRPPSPNLNIAQYSSPYSHPPTPQQISLSQATSSTGRTTIEQPMDFLPCDVMEALIEEDMERLRARRRSACQPRRTGGPGSIPSPSGSTFSVDSTSSSVILGLGTGVGIRDVLPLKSNFFDWCCEYFTEPQMRVSNALFLGVYFIPLANILFLEANGS